VDWSALKDLTDAAALDAAASTLLIAADRYTSISFYDALNRPIQTVTPHRAGMLPSVLRSSYNEANFVETIDVWVRRASAPTTLLDPATADLHAVTDIDYNARGQRILLALGNGTVTTYDHDPLTFRLARLVTTRPSSFGADKRVVQDLAYTYDPAGNITRIRDAADIHNVIFFDNQRVEPSSDYEYDPLYRLIRATGREHLGQSGGGLNAPQQIGHDDSLRIRLPHPSDGNAMGTYKETYAYDPVGNLLTMMHQVSSGSWTRRYSYTEKSRITAVETCNRLSATSIPGDPVDGPYSERYEHDDHGNMTRMPHLSKLTWDEQDRLRSTARQVTAGTPETTYYAYDPGSQRTRKVTDSTAGTRRTERLYLGGIEIYRELDTDGETVKLERETLHVSAEPDRIALIETRTAGSDAAPELLVRYQYENNIGSATLELDETARVISCEEYFPYGSTSYQAVASRIETAKRYRYTRLERDEESGLYYHVARYCACWLGRWTSADPKGLVDGTNVFSYCRGNPISFMDPEGTESEHEKYMRIYNRELAKYEKAANAPRGIDLIGKLVFGVTGLGAGIAGGLAAGATVTASLLGVGGGFAGGKLAGKAAEAVLPKNMDQRVREFAIGLSELLGGALGGMAGGAVGNRLAPSPGLAGTRTAAGGVSGPLAESGSGTGDFIVLALVKGRVSGPAGMLDTIKYRIALALRREFSESQVGNKNRSHLGDAESVAVEKGPLVESTKHAHVVKRVAQPSGQDINVYGHGGYSPKTKHSILGEKWAFTRHATKALGVKPPPLKVVRTTFTQEQLSSTTNTSGPQGLPAVTYELFHRLLGFYFP
jgi:RHS repeat-associated protein